MNRHVDPKSLHPAAWSVAEAKTRFSEVVACAKAGKLHSVTGGGAMFSDLHSNFMINPGEATAADIEGLGDAVRADVLAKTGVSLEWEIKRIGRPAT